MDGINTSFLIPSPMEQIENELLGNKNITLFVKRDDLIHPWLSGNKYRKLKYNIAQAKDHNKKMVITFGGAFSNHLYATAAACSLYGLQSIGIIRGDIDSDNPTIKFCIARGMKLIPVSRSSFRLKHESKEIQDIVSTYYDPYVIPEGGTNSFALKGVEELIHEINQQILLSPDYIILASGTGGTTAGLLTSDELRSKVISFSALKSDHLTEEILRLAGNKNNQLLTVISDYHFGGYGKWNNELLNFITEFEDSTGVLLDHVYNGKAMYGLYDMIRNDFFAKGSTLCYLHTGGLQGKSGLAYMKMKKRVK
ncbi:MAG: 1-aminocyclopropane-1-carboxylate deaminase/D-cysteine desulfhydrase [Saprospiraceae bacterium]|nr:1-aminocyclopropane-1-carboxylate deaminase/D-cysteine desulfhydrase [Saprospiraceae bacterium]